MGSFKRANIALPYNPRVVGMLACLLRAPEWTSQWSRHFKPMNSAHLHFLHPPGIGRVIRALSLPKQYSVACAASTRWCVREKNGSSHRVNTY